MSHSKIFKGSDGTNIPVAPHIKTGATKVSGNAPKKSKPSAFNKYVHAVSAERPGNASNKGVHQ